MKFVESKSWARLAPPCWWTGTWRPAAPCSVLHLQLYSVGGWSVLSVVCVVCPPQLLLAGTVFKFWTSFIMFCFCLNWLTTKSQTKVSQSQTVTPFAFYSGRMDVLGSGRLAAGDTTPHHVPAAAARYWSLSISGSRPARSRWEN